MPQFMLLAVLIVGAIGLFLALPGARTSVRRAGAILLIAAGAGLLYGAAQYAAGAPLAGFMISAVVALFAALHVITHTRAVYSALYFVLLVAAVTALLVLLEAEFLAAALLLIYAGAILVTYVFVIMLAQQARLAPYDARARDPLLGVLAGFLLLAALGAQLGVSRPTARLQDENESPPATATPGEAASPLAATPEPPAEGDEHAAIVPPPPAAQTAGTVENVGTPLLTHYIVGVEIAGVLLLAAMIGAIAIARRRPEDAPEPEEIGPSPFEPGPRKPAMPLDGGGAC